MKCSSCGAEIKEGAEFCVVCGKKLPKRKKCPKCGTEVLEDVMFCTNCGNRFEQKTEPVVYYEEEESSSPWKWVAIALIATLLVGGGAYGMFYMMPQKNMSDLETFNLKGYVKSATKSPNTYNCYFLSPNELQFDEKGNLIKCDDFSFKYSDEGSLIKSTWSDEACPIDISRNSRGQISSISIQVQNMFWDMSNALTLNYDINNKLSNINWYFEEDSRGGKATYDSNGNITAIEENDCGGATTYRYKYLTFDKQGNWTKREVHFHLESAYEDEDVIDRTEIEERTIEYYN